MRVGKAFLDRLGVAIAADETSRQKLVKAISDTKSQDQEQGSSHCSLSIHCSELTVFLGYQDRELLSMLCKWYDCEARYVKDTHSRGREEVPNVWATLLGATTPGQLQASLPEDAVGSGFTSRVVFVFQANKGKLVEKPTLDKELGEALFRSLEQIKSMAGPFTITTEAEERYFTWYRNSEENKPFNDPRLDYYAQRRPTHLFKVAMIYSASRTDKMIIELQDMEDAIKTLENTEKNMPAVFAGVGANPLAGLQLRLLRILEEKKELSFAEIEETFFSDANSTQLGEIIASLEKMRKCVVYPAERKLVFRE